MYRTKSLLLCLIGPYKDLFFNLYLLFTTKWYTNRTCQGNFPVQDRNFGNKCIYRSYISPLEHLYWYIFCICRNRCTKVRMASLSRYHDASTFSSTNFSMQYHTINMYSSILHSGSFRRGEGLLHSQSSGFPLLVMIRHKLVSV